MPKVPARRPSRKPRKPHPDFPLFPHGNGQWCKKIRGKQHFFGVWADPDAALRKYLDQRDDLLAGRTPRVRGDGLTVRELVNHFLTAKRHQLDTTEITERTFADYYSTCERIVAAFGKTRLVDDLDASDFQQLRATIAKTNGPVSLGNEVQRVRVLFKYAYDACLIDRPIRYGPTFKRLSKKVLRRARQENGSRMFEAAELRVMLAAASPHLRAMILLGVNCGFGNHDCGTLPKKALDFERGWVSYPRPRTGIERRCPLWPETVSDLRQAIAERPEPKDKVDADLVFITKYGKRWSNDTKANPISAECRKLLVKLGLYRRGLGFYALRHTFETVAGDSRDQVTVDHIMGHARNDMARVYRERISDDRLRAVVDHVQNWLFGG